MRRIKNKITGVEFWDSEKSLYLYRTLPNVRHGADLTMTVLMDLFNKRRFDRAEELYINWDGASDNINYTCIYSLTYLLVCAEKEGWPLHLIDLLRYISGHTG